MNPANRPPAGGIGTCARPGRTDMEGEIKINIKNLRGRAVIGVTNAERRGPQDLIFNVAMTVDAREAARSDDLCDTIDYSAVKRRIIEQAEQSNFRLLETLAHHILQTVMEDPKVLEATVEVDKPHALGSCDSVSVSCRMRREE